MGLFCSIVRKKNIYKPQKSQSCKLPHQSSRPSIFCEDPGHGTPNNRLTEAQQSIQRMEIASLKRFVFIRLARVLEDTNKKMLFFTPTEELHGGNMFSKMSNNYAVIQPYIEMIDGEFITLMNQNVHNIAMYVDPDYITANGQRASFEPKQTDKKVTGKKLYTADNTELFNEYSGDVHMYQTDISGQNAIDYAFKKNAIYCIKAFVETLLILTKESNSFRNCFDKAVLTMIHRGMDVKELITSPLFYPPIWIEVSIFSPNQDPVIIPYNGEVEELLFEDPNVLYSKANDDQFDQGFDGRNRSLAEREMIQRRESYYRRDSVGALQHQSKDEQFEMQFNYIAMNKIQGKEPIQFSRVLTNCADVTVFQQEAIQHIINYKWDTYTKNFFLLKFVLYFIFVFLYIYDLESIHYPDAETGNRVKDAQFYINKSVCLLIQLLFLVYEFLQVKWEGTEYFTDFWNYMEVSGIGIFAVAAVSDLLLDRPTDAMKIMFSISILLCLFKIVYLVRVFRNLNFLVTMLMTVIVEIYSFMVLFMIFLLAFAECYHILLVDISAYGRTPELAAHALATLRMSMGDFALLDPYQSFDIIEETNPDGSIAWRHSILMTYFTWIIWCISCFILFMIFMNFIIAVIGDTYSRVIENKDAHDYKQRVAMIYEREVHFNEEDFENQIYFPNVLVVRKKKDQSAATTNMQGWASNIKNHAKFQAQRCIDMLNMKTKEQKQHLTNTIKTIETNVTSMNSEINLINQEIVNVTLNQQNATELIKQRNKSSSSSSSRHKTSSPSSSSSSSSEKTSKKKSNPKKSSSQRKQNSSRGQDGQHFSEQTAIIGSKPDAGHRGRNPPKTKQQKRQARGNQVSRQRNRDSQIVVGTLDAHCGREAQRDEAQGRRESQLSYPSSQPNYQSDVSSQRKGLQNHQQKLIQQSNQRQFNQLKNLITTKFDVLKAENEEINSSIEELFQMQRQNQDLIKRCIVKNERLSQEGKNHFQQINHGLMKANQDLKNMRQGAASNFASLANSLFEPTRNVVQQQPCNLTSNISQSGLNRVDIRSALVPQILRRNFSRTPPPVMSATSSLGLQYPQARVYNQDMADVKSDEQKEQRDRTEEALPQQWNFAPNAYFNAQDMPSQHQQIEQILHQQQNDQPGMIQNIGYNQDEVEQQIGISNQHNEEDLNLQEVIQKSLGGFEINDPGLGQIQSASNNDALSQLANQRAKRKDKKGSKLR